MWNVRVRTTRAAELLTNIRNKIIVMCKRWAMSLCVTSILHGMNERSGWVLAYRRKCMDTLFDNSTKWVMFVCLCVCEDDTWGARHHPCTAKHPVTYSMSTKNKWIVLSFILVDMNGNHGAALQCLIDVRIKTKISFHNICLVISLRQSARLGIYYAVGGWITLSCHPCNEKKKNEMRNSANRRTIMIWIIQSQTLHKLWYTSNSSLSWKFY